MYLLDHCNLRQKYYLCNRAWYLLDTSTSTPTSPLFSEGLFCFMHFFSLFVWWCEIYFIDLFLSNKYLYT